MWSPLPASTVIDSSLSSLSSPPGHLAGGGLAGGGGLGEGVGGGGWGRGRGWGRGHFIHPIIYCSSSWCFALKGLRTKKLNSLHSRPKGRRVRLTDKLKFHPLRRCPLPYPGSNATCYTTRCDCLAVMDNSQFSGCLRIHVVPCSCGIWCFCFSGKASSRPAWQHPSALRVFVPHKPQTLSLDSENLWRFEVMVTTSFRSMTVSKKQLCMNKTVVVPNKDKISAKMNISFNAKAKWGSRNAYTRLRYHKSVTQGSVILRRWSVLQSTQQQTTGHGMALRWWRRRIKPSAARATQVAKSFLFWNRYFRHDTDSSCTNTPRKY